MTMRTLLLCSVFVLAAVAPARAQEQESVTDQPPAEAYRHPSSWELALPPMSMYAWPLSVRTSVPSG